MILIISIVIAKTILIDRLFHYFLTCSPKPDPHHLLTDYETWETV